MQKYGRYFLIKAAYICIDFLCIGFSIYVACQFRAAVALPFEVTPQNIFFNPVNPFRSLFLFWIITTIYLNHSHGLYQTKRELFESIEIWEVIKSAVLSTLIIIVVIYMIKVPDFPRSILLLVTVFIIVSCSLWRLIKRIFVNYLVSQGYNNFHVLIIGGGSISQKLAEEIKKRPSLGLNIVGILDDSESVGLSLHGFPVLGKISDLSNIVRREFVDMIFIGGQQDNRQFIKILEDAKKLEVSVRVVPYGFEFMSPNVYKYNIGVIPILEYMPIKIEKKQAGKRFFDFLLSLFLIVLFAPLFLMLAVLIKLDSPGPVLYFSRRFGKGGRIFYMLKFRSMVRDADKIIDKIKHKNEVDGPIFKIRNDPRITGMGRFLRKYSLDELPQLVNVFKGDMSLVGPRPLPISQI